MKEMIIFVGMQASGKSTFFKENFADTHVRVNLDMLNSKQAMWDIITACCKNNISLVIDNTNPMKTTRKLFIDKAKLHGYKIKCYLFDSNYDECLERNNKRQGKAVIPESGLRRFRDTFEMPTLDEGFDEINKVQLCKIKYVITKI